MSSRKIKTLLIGFLCAAAVVSFFLGTGEHSVKVDLGVYEALGAVTAEETAKLLPEKAKVLVVVRDTGNEKNPSIDAQIAAFGQTLKKRRGLRMAVKRFSASPMLMMATGGGISPDQFREILETHKDVEAIVLFCPLPPLAASDLALLKNRRLKLVVAASFRPEYAELISREVLHMVIAPRDDRSMQNGAQPRNLRDIFNNEFVIIRAENIQAGN